MGMSKNANQQTKKQNNGEKIGFPPVLKRIQNHAYKQQPLANRRRQNVKIFDEGGSKSLP